MTPLKEIGECVITVGDEDFFFRPSLINMARIGEPGEIVQAFYDLHHDEVTTLINSAIASYGSVPAWVIEHIKSNAYGRTALIASMIVLDACCLTDASILTGYLHPGKRGGRAFKRRKGLMPEIEMLLVAQSLITHGVIGKAKVRRLQRNETGEATKEFNIYPYISAARHHFGMSRAEAEQLTMTEFQELLAQKYPAQKGFTREEYEAVADDYLAKKARKLAKQKQ